MDQGALEPIGGAWNFDREYHKFCDILGLNPVKRQDSRMAERVYFIVKAYGGKTLNEKRERLLKARKELGSNELGELLVNDLYHVARLKSDVGIEKDNERELQKDQEKEKADRKAAQVESEAQKKLMDTQKAIDMERARIKELTDLKARVEQVQGGNYATT